MAMNPATPSDLHEIALDFRFAGWLATIPGVEAVVMRAAQSALAAAAPAQGATESAVVLADDAFVQELNRTYRGIDKPTNVLSFENAGGDAWHPEGAPRLLGDVVVAFETTVREAADQEIPPSDHLSHLIVHGILHLLGYDHDTDDRAAGMERLEVDILARLGIGDPYRAEVCDGQGR